MPHYAITAFTSTTQRKPIFLHDEQNDIVFYDNFVLASIALMRIVRGDTERIALYYAVWEERLK